MKLNWLGKAFIGAAGAYAVGKVLEGATASSEDDTFSEAEVKALANACAAGDYALFTSIYRARRPWADNANVAKSWGIVGESLR